MHWIRQYVLIVAAFISLTLMPTYAYAFQVLQCDGSGGVAAGTLFDEDVGAQGSSCEYANEPIIEHAFSMIICSFTRILNSVMGAMYCGLQYALLDVVKLVLTIYVAIYGAQMVMGTAQLSARDGLLRLIKLGVVWAVASNAAYGIQFIFEFFVAFIATASKAVISTLAFAVPVDNDGTCSNVALDGSDLLTLYNFLDYLVCHTLVGPASSASTKILGFFMAMIWTLPPMYGTAAWWITTTFWTLLRTVIGFLKALAAIGFLITLSPIFLSFMLFKTTAYLFENWLRYMIAFSVQVVVVFGIIVCWVMALYQFVGFFNELADLIFPYTPTEVPGPVYSPIGSWAICPPVYGTNANGEPTAKCTSGFDANPPDCNQWSCQPPTNPNWEQDAQELIPPSKVINQGDFLYYVFFHLITLLLITYAFSVLLEKADDIARSLAGPSNVPKLFEGVGQRGHGDYKTVPAPAMAKQGGADMGKSARALAGNLHKMVGNRK